MVGIGACGADMGCYCCCGEAADVIQSSYRKERRRMDHQKEIVIAKVPGGYIVRYIGHQEESVHSSMESAFSEAAKRLCYKDCHVNIVVRKVRRADCCK